jgi:hypothetical protein
MAQCKKLNANCQILSQDVKHKKVSKLVFMSVTDNMLGYVRAGL